MMIKIVTERFIRDEDFMSYVMAHTMAGSPLSAQEYVKLKEEGILVFEDLLEHERSRSVWAIAKDVPFDSPFTKDTAPGVKTYRGLADPPKI
jgi:hypothetical protein